jgi:uncharacterized membrane protein YeaQ/YmgE (transglycosylase-associated protein family)
MDVQSLIIWLVIGAVAGWLAGVVVVTAFGFGLIGNIVVGIVGSFIAGWLLPKIGVKSIVKNAIVDQIIFAFIGAVILLVILGLLSRSGLLHS